MEAVIQSVEDLKRIIEKHIYPYVCDVTCEELLTKKDYSKFHLYLHDCIINPNCLTLLAIELKNSLPKAKKVTITNGFNDIVVEK